MSQSRKKRVIVFNIRITCYTDFMQEFLSNTIKQTVKAMQIHEKNKGRLTEITLKEI